MTTVLGFYLSILYFRLEVLINRLFLFKIFCDVLKKSSRCSSEPLFRMRFGKISCYLTSCIVFVPSDLRDIGDKEALRYIQYPEKNVIELFIISNKTPCFFIYEWPRIIRYCPNFIISKGARVLVYFPIDNVG